MDGKKKLEELVAGLDGVTPGFGRWIRLFGDRTVYTRDPQDGCRIHAVVRADDPGQNAVLDHIARCDPDTIRSISDAYKAMEADNERLRKIVSECATALSNGAHIDPGCTVEFMGELPREIALRIASLQGGSRHEG